MQHIVVVLLTFWVSGFNLTCWYLLAKAQCIPTLHGGRIVSSAQPLLTRKLFLFKKKQEQNLETFKNIKNIWVNHTVQSLDIEWLLRNFSYYWAKVIKPISANTYSWCNTNNLYHIIKEKSSFFGNKTVDQRSGLFWPACGVRSTQMLVKIYNTCYKIKSFTENWYFKMSTYCQCRSKIEIHKSHKSKKKHVQVPNKKLYQTVSKHSLKWLLHPSPSSSIFIKNKTYFLITFRNHTIFLYTFNNFNRMNNLSFMVPLVPMKQQYLRSISSYYGMIY